MTYSKYVQEEDQDVVIMMTSGPSTPQRCATPFFVGSLLAAMDAKVKIFFTMEGVSLLKKGVPESLVAKDGGKLIIDFMREAKQSGVQIYCCLPALPGHEVIDRSELIDEVDEVVGGGVLADLVLSADKVLSF